MSPDFGDQVVAHYNVAMPAASAGRDNHTGVLVTRSLYRWPRYAPRMAPDVTT